MYLFFCLNDILKNQINSFLEYIALKKKWCTKQERTLVKNNTFK